MPRASRQSGWMLIELLLSTAIMCSVMGVLLYLGITAQHVLLAQADGADMQQRLRVAGDTIQRDLRMAGAGPSQGGWRGRLTDLLPAVMPARTGVRRADAELSQFSDRISILFVPDTPVQTSLVSAMEGPAAPLLIDGGAPGCPAGGTCGFAPGDRALVLDTAGIGAGYDLLTVSAVGAGQVSSAEPLSRAYSSGTPVVRVVQRVYYLDRAANRLMVYDGDGSDVPLVDHVVDLRVTYYADAAGGPIAPAQLTDGPVCGRAPNRFDLDLLRVRRIAVTIRLETEATEFRGAGPAFLRPGRSTGGVRYVPDLQATFEVSPRNMGPVR